MESAVVLSGHASQGIAVLSTVSVVLPQPTARRAVKHSTVVQGAIAAGLPPPP